MRKLPVIIAAAAAIALLAAPNAYANTSSATLCLTNDNTQCADVKDALFRDQTPIWLYDQSDANAAYFSELVTVPGVCDGDTDNGCVAAAGWFPFTDHTMDESLDGYNSAEIGIKPVPGAYFCVGEFGGSVILKSSSSCTSDNPYTTWIVDGNYLINVERSNTKDLIEVLAAQGSSNKTYLQTAELTSSGGIFWEKWTYGFGR